MSAALLDVNVLVAIHDTAHPNYDKPIPGSRRRNGAVMPLSGVEKSPLVSEPALVLLEPGSGGPKKTP